MTTGLLITFFIILGLELVLGLDNVVMIGLVTAQCAPEYRERTRKLGILFAVLGRLVLLASVGFLLTLTTPFITIETHVFSFKDIVLLTGGLFLLYKTSVELHRCVATENSEHSQAKHKHISVGMAIVQICALDIVFSIDSVITAVGLTDSYFVIASAIICSTACMFFLSAHISRFIHNNPTIKVMALAFLLVIGVVICFEAFGEHIPKAYIYLPLGFCLLVEWLQLLQKKNARV